MLVDPFGSRLVAGDSPKPGQGRVEFLVEVCDPSEAAEFGYSVNGILMSDFYTPRFFDPLVAPGVRYSFTGALTEPRQVLRGGYLSWHDPVSDHWWQQTWFSGAAPRFRDLGVLTASAGGIRAQIDRITAAETAKAIEPARPAATAAGLVARVVQELFRVESRALARADQRAGESPAAVDRGGRHARGPARTPRAVRSDGALLRQTSTNGAAVAAPLTLAGLLAT